MLCYFVGLLDNICSWFILPKHVGMLVCWMTYILLMV